MVDGGWWMDFPSPPAPSAITNQMGEGVRIFTIHHPLKSIHHASRLFGHTVTQETRS